MTTTRRTTAKRTTASAAPAVPVGLATSAGLSAALAAYALAIIAFVNGDRTEETITALSVGTVTLVSVVWGRMLQAIALAKQAQ